jgi:hypothetical protein
MCGRLRVGKEAGIATMVDGVTMNDTDTNVTEDLHPNDLDGLTASLDHLRLWCEPAGAATIPAANY